MNKRKLIYGWGINDADYNVHPRIDGKRFMCPYYRKWTGMLERQTPKFWETNPTYTGVKVWEGWKSFMAFRAWMLPQNHAGLQLDKDLLGDGKLYSPENCVFVSHAVNCFTTDSGAARGEWPIGVSKEGNRFKAVICVYGEKSQVTLGRFATPHEAHMSWVVKKWELGCDLMEAQTCPRTSLGLWWYIIKL